MEFTHFDKNGQAIMVDVTGKSDHIREAWAKGSIYMSRACLSMVRSGSVEKGDVLGVARIGGIMGAKKTSELIPLCHLLNTTKAELWFGLEEDCINVVGHTKAVGKTGVEMEALTAVSIALLTIYDMCKAVDKSMKIGEISLCKKTGGKSGLYLDEEAVSALPASLREEAGL